MFEIIALIIVVAVSAFSIKQFKTRTINEVNVPPDMPKKLKALWKETQQHMKEKKYIAAEKALLKILKVDQKNAPAYNRLGILYSKQQKYEDAIECFEIASNVAPSPSNLHNLGLVFYETKQYNKASVAFERALDLEPSALRYLAYAKAQHQLGNMKKVIDALEKANEIKVSAQALRLLIEVYELTEQNEKAEEAREELNEVEQDKKYRNKRTKAAQQTAS